MCSCRHFIVMVHELHCRMMKLIVTGRDGGDYQCCNEMGRLDGVRSWKYKTEPFAVHEPAIVNIIVQVQKSPK